MTHNWVVWIIQQCSKNNITTLGTLYHNAEFIKGSFWALCSQTPGQNLTIIIQKRWFGQSSNVRQAILGCKVPCKWKWDFGWRHLRVIIGLSQPNTLPIIIFLLLKTWLGCLDHPAMFHKHENWYFALYHRFWLPKIIILIVEHCWMVQTTLLVWEYWDFGHVFGCLRPKMTLKCIQHCDTSYLLL